MGRRRGSKNKSKSQDTLPSPIPITVAKPAIYRELPLSRIKSSAPISSLTLARKKLNTEYREYCLKIVDMAERQGVLNDLFHLMHAFKLILQGHHAGMASDESYKSNREQISDPEQDLKTR